MVSAINFAVRTSAGSTQLGTVAGEGQSNLIAVQPGQSISLNLSPGSVVSYTQQGSDLVVQLMDGRTIVLSGYFTATDGVENKLYLSSNDEIVEVRVADGVDGVLFADYGPVEAMEKWSPLDNLRFSEADVLDDAMVASNEPAGMAGLVPGLLAGGGTAAGIGGLGTAAALAGGAALLSSGGSSSTTDNSGDNSSSGGSTGGGSTGGGSTGGGSAGGGSTGGGSTGGGSGSTHTPPAVDPRSTSTLTTNTNNPSVVVTGTGHPGDTVAVTIGGTTTNTTIGTDGTWSVTLTGANLPADGTYVPTVVVTNTVSGGTTTLTGSTYIIDMTPPAFAVQDGTTSVGDVHNIATYTASGGATVITGTGEAGATMRVTANGHTQIAVVAPNGTWSVSFTQAQLPAGDYHTVPVSITSTDVNGNVSAALTTTIAIDTVANAIAVSAVAGDGTVNLVESQNGFIASGTSVPGAQLTITLGGVSQPVTVGANGQWTASFAGGLLTQNGTSATMTLTSTDAAGNPNTVTHQVRVDTVATVAANTVAGNNILNAAENSAQIAVTGTAEVGTQSVNVTWGGQTLAATVNATTGAWSVNFPANLFGSVNATSTVMTVQSVDAYGNIGTATRNVTVDTLATASFAANQAFGTSVNAADAAAGVNLTGLADAGSSVVVNFEGQTRTVIADSNGNWTANFSMSHLLGAGAIDATQHIATVIATDVNGNTSAAQTLAVTIDTLAPSDPFVTADTGQGAELGGIFTAAAPGDYSYFAVGQQGAATPVTVSGTINNTVRNGINSDFAMFEDDLPNGSYLVIRDVDAAGNESSTLYLRSTTEVNIDLDRQGLQGFDFGTIDLTSADANLTLDAATVLALTGADHQMTVTGNGDDIVNLDGATDTGTRTVMNGDTYRLYTLGSGASVLVDDDMLINVNAP